MLECSHVYPYYCSIVFASPATMTTPMGVLQPSSFIGRTRAIGGPTTSIPSFLKCSWRGGSIHGASFPASVPQVGFRSKQTAVRSSVEPSGGEFNLWLCPSFLHVFVW
jgi:hypothetical protein